MHGSDYNCSMFIFTKWASRAAFQQWGDCWNARLHTRCGYSSGCLIKTSSSSNPLRKAVVTSTWCSSRFCWVDKAHQCSERFHPYYWTEGLIIISSLLLIEATNLALYLSIAPAPSVFTLQGFIQDFQLLLLLLFFFCLGTLVPRHSAVIIGRRRVDGGGMHMRTRHMLSMRIINTPT